MFNYQGPAVTQMEGMEVVEQLKCLGVVVCNRRNCFCQHKKYKIQQARKMVSMTYSIIARSCNKLIIGKTYWKSVLLPDVLHASFVLTWTRKESDELQIIKSEDRFWVGQGILQWWPCRARLGHPQIEVGI